MELYAGIDLHSTNSYIVILNQNDDVVFNKRLPNDMERVLCELAKYKDSIRALAVESTNNWYWLVDGLLEEGYQVKLANPNAMKQYDGLKHTDDKHDARWIAHMLRLGILPCGYIYPRRERGVRDLLRKRMQLVQKRSSHKQSMQNIFSRYLGHKLPSNKINQLIEEDVDNLVLDPNQSLAIKCNMRVMKYLTVQIQELEKVIKKQVKMKQEFKQLMTVPGIGEILALTIMLETGDISRFQSPGNYASYCRCVTSKKTSNGKKKGKGNTNNGNKYLCWAYMEAAYFSIRFSAPIKRFYQRKMAHTMKMVAQKAVAHKLARACFYIMRDHVYFEIDKQF
jgi:transposase